MSTRHRTVKAPKRTKKTVGRLLRDWREGLKKTGKQMSAYVRVDAAAWSRWENDRAVPEGRAMAKLVKKSRGIITADAMLAAALVSP